MDHQETIIKTVEKVVPAVVNIAIVKEAQAVQEELYSELFRMGVPFRSDELQSRIKQAPHDEEGRIQIGHGSGFIISPHGIILTNKHVISDPEAGYTVVTANNKKYDALVLARDPINDIAILKIKADEGETFPIIELGDSENIKLGQSVIAIGDALGQFQNTVSTGVISGLSRLIQAVTNLAGNQERLRGLIQTDAAINPGNSGGPLVDLEGKVVAINTAVVFGAQNIGFAIPINRAKKDLIEIKEHGKIRRPFLGVRYLILNKALQEKFQLPLDHGALIINEGIPGDVAVIPGSASDKAGLKELDVILSCNNKEITEKETLEDILSGYSVGDKIELEILRDNEKFNTALKLGEMK